MKNLTFRSRGQVCSVLLTAVLDCFVEIFPGKESLCHISELSHSQITNVSEVVKEGQTLYVKALYINEIGHINLSYKAALPTPVKS